MTPEIFIALMAATVQSGTPILYATLGEIFTDVVLFASYPRNLETCSTECLGLRYSACGIEIEQVRRGAMCLVPGGAALGFRPVHPYFQIIKMQVCQCFPVVSFDSCNSLGIAFAKKCRQVFHQVAAYQCFAQPYIPG